MSKTYWTINKSGKVQRFNWDEPSLLPPKVARSMRRRKRKLQKEGLLFDTQEQARANLTTGGN